MNTFENLKSLPRKTKLDPQTHREALKELKLAALEMRRKILYLGHRNRITLHYGALMSMTEIVITLYLLWLNLKTSDPGWPQRDRFVLSKGHGAPTIYVALAMLGFFPETHFDGFRRLDSILQGHPDRCKTPGIDASSGSLGQGLPVACGMALGAKIDRAPYRVYSLVSDAECNEGSIWEAALIASNLQLDRLIMLLDRNHKSSYGLMSGRNDVEPLADKWRAFNWAVFDCDGHDFVSITSALSEAELVQKKPSVILCHTTKGKGLYYTEEVNTKAHIFLSEEKYEECLEELNEKEQEIL